MPTGLGNFGPPASRRVMLMLLVALALCVAAPLAPAQTYAVIHNFSGGGDGATPMAGLTADKSGNFYGTAAYGGHSGGNCGVNGCGVVFRLSRQGPGWVLNPVYSFLGGNDGANPQANIVLDADNDLYGSTYAGGGVCSGAGCGTVFKLQPNASACKGVLCPWNETVLHSFTGFDGSNPVGLIAFDQTGDIFGATSTGGFRNGGAVYELQPSDDGWSSKLLYNAYGYPYGGVISDNAGNLYGSAFIGGNGKGSVYEVSPSGGGWMGRDIYDFADGNDGGFPQAGLIFDGAGNLYGATTTGGAELGGTVFELTPSGDQWNLTTIYSFTNPNNGRQVVGPVGSLLMDQAGNLYGTTFADGAYGFGAVFKLTPGSGGWSYTSLHDFTGGSDGGNPYSNLVFDANGNLYGTASVGGSGPCLNGCGVVFQIAP